jgi:transketolase C-terminal domain/subunit
LDLSTIDRILTTYSHVITLEEHVYAGGLGMNVQARAQELQVNACTIETICLRDEFLHTYGSKDDLLDLHGISVQSIASALAMARG